MTEQRLILSDAAIRAALRSRLLIKHADNANPTVVIDELGLCRGQVRVDVTVVNGLLHGYEIKSDRDSLRRLDAQVEIYGKVLDRATLVVGERHLAEALNILPRWWGVLYVSQRANEPQFTTVRHSRNNPLRDPRSLVELLWLCDALDLLEQRDAARGIRSKPRRDVWNRICEHFSVDEIAAAVRAKLKARVKSQAHPSPSKCGE